MMEGGFMIFKSRNFMFKSRLWTNVQIQISYLIYSNKQPCMFFQFQEYSLISSCKIYLVPDAATFW